MSPKPASQSDAPPPADATPDDLAQDLAMADAEVQLLGTDRIIKNAVIAAMGVGLVPIPVVDLVGLVGIQLKMVHSLAQHYGVSFSEHLGRSLILSLVGGALPLSATVAASSLLKLIPGIGTLAGGATLAVSSGAITYAVGQVFAQHFESGGTLLDFDPARFRERFRQAMRQGEAVAEELDTEQSPPTP